VEGFPATDQSVTNRAFTGDAITARRAAAQMRVHSGTFIRLRAAVHVRRKQRFNISTLSHDSHRTSGTLASWHLVTHLDAALALPSARDCVNRSCSIRRPREIRDITVPIGTSRIRAISA
jgi:hypothetical protein